MKNIFTCMVDLDKLSGDKVLKLAEAFGYKSCKEEILKVLDDRLNRLIIILKIVEDGGPMPDPEHEKDRLREEICGIELAKSYVGDDDVKKAKEFLMNIKAE